MTQYSIAQSIVRAPDFWVTTLRMAMITGETLYRTQSLSLRTSIFETLAQGGGGTSETLADAEPMSSQVTMHFISCEETLNKLLTCFIIVDTTCYNFRMMLLHKFVIPLQNAATTYCFMPCHGRYVVYDWQFMSCNYKELRANDGCVENILDVYKFDKITVKITPMCLIWDKTFLNTN